MRVVCLEEGDGPPRIYVLVPLHPSSNRSLGTPDEVSWPGVKALPDYKPDFPRWAARRDAYSRICPTLDAAGLDLLSKMLVYSPARRISAKDAMRHPFFDDLDRVSWGVLCCSLP